MNPKKSSFDRGATNKRVFLMLEPPNLPTIAEKIRGNIQIRSKNITKINLLP